MAGSRIRLGVAAAVALAAGIGAASATGSASGAAAGSDPAAGQAIVDVSTPELPAGEGAQARARWHSLRARSNRLLDAVAERNQLVVQSRIPETGQLIVRLGGESIASLRAALAGDPRVRRAEADRTAELRYTPNDFAFNNADVHAPGGDLYQWHVIRDSAPRAWDLSKGAGAEVAVIDSGADVTHPDLAGRISGRLDCDPTPCAGTNVTDPNGHGTHVAGLACADSDNVYGLASVGFDCNLFVIRVVTCAAVGAAIVAAANRGSDAISMSLGGCSSTIADEVDYAWGRGSVPVAAGTNTPTPGGNNYPAARVQPEGTGPSIDSGEGLVVTAAKHDGNRATIAQQTSGVSVAAFGFATDAIGGQQGIISTWPAGTVSYEIGPNPCNCRTVVNGANRFAYLVGTSMATPQVAGLVALMRAAQPTISAPKLVRLVKLTASHCAQYGSVGLGWGVIRADRAVAAALDKDIDPPVSSLRRGRAGKLRVKSSDRKGGAAECSDEIRAAGIKTVRIFASRNGKDYRRIGKTRKPSFPFRPKRKGRYRFYSIAVDKEGNEEAAPGDADAKLRVKRISRRR